MRWILLALAIALPLLMAACAANKTAIQHYDECAVENSSFEAMVACGKQRRTAYCQEHNNCSADGNAFVAYADSLVASVNRHEMTEAEAQRRWIEFRTAQVNTQRQLAIQAAAAAAASGPTTCVRNGPVTNCY
jgi:uncharacterized protein YecT (DUF1311 family)